MSPARDAALQSREAPAPEALPDHLIALPDGSGEWALWRTVCVRGAGFPAAAVLRAADAECAAAADRMDETAGAAEPLREAALEAVREELAVAAKERLDVLVPAIQRLKKGKPPKTAGLGAPAVAAIESWREAAARAEAARAEYERAFAAAQGRLSRAVREVGTGERFREALLWQNPHAARTGLASLLARREDDRARTRERELMLAFYLQRYCTKNDTIGFFGPVGWARLAEGEKRLVARPGPELLAARQVFFEGWVIDALANVLGEDPAMRPWLLPRLSPLLRREGANFVTPGGLRVQLGPVSAALFPAFDGTRPIGELLREVIENPNLATPGESLLYKMVFDFRERGILSLGFQIPLTLDPERVLHQRLLAIGDPALRESALARHAELVAARDEVAGAAGRPEALDRALRELEEKFTRATGLSPYRDHGKNYAGRTLIYEDCRRDLDLELGAPFLAEVAPALSLLLAGARWYTHHVASHQRQMLTAVHAELAAQAGSPVLDLPSFAKQALPALVNARVQEELQRELYTRWERVLALPAGERRVRYTSAELRPRVLAEMPARGPGWLRARHHSPDLLVAAESVEAFERGDYEVVVGEIHLAVNTIDRAVFVAQHPDPEELLAAFDLDLPEPNVNPLLPKQWNQQAAAAVLGFVAPGATARVDTGLHSAKDYYLDLSLDPPVVPPDRVLNLGEMVVEPGPDGEGLVVGPRDGRVRFDLVDFFQLAMMLQAVRSFRVLAPRPHTPRVTVDRLVLARETWTFPAGELAFTRAETAAERFAGARRWGRAHGMPRFLFAKTPAELKPFYLDLESPLYVEIFARSVRKTAERSETAQIVVSEMLPEPGRAWLPDAEGNRYTSELRMVAVDRT